MNYCEKCKRDLPDGEKCPVCAPKKGVFIEMEMPKNCKECPFLYDGGSCIVNNDISDDTLEVLMREMMERPAECPLQEVKE